MSPALRAQVRERAGNRCEYCQLGFVSHRLLQIVNTPDKFIKERSTFYLCAGDDSETSYADCERAFLSAVLPGEANAVCGGEGQQGALH
ncbi:MAG: hypothetical protein DME21_05955 [Verrucomicrobia bacterium]|nr:MAG: hypothetical protein DME21_05955 [Verrucomicrobiota bacterium]